MSDTVTEMDYGAVLKALPHRPPFLLIDKVVDIVADDSATGIKLLAVMSLISPAIFQAIL